jgi:hypothetical protein
MATLRRRYERAKRRGEFPGRAVITTTELPDGDVDVRERYRVEVVFEVLKQKLGSWLAVAREEMAKKMAWAAALLYNLSMLVASGYLDGSICLLSKFLRCLCSRKPAYNVRL